MLVFSTTRAGARAIAADCLELGVRVCADELTRGDAGEFLSECPLTAGALARDLRAAADWAAFLGSRRVSTRTEAGGYPFTCEIEPSLAGWVGEISRALIGWP